jgi:nucleotide-binding universal stress UspA family protein
VEEAHADLLVIGAEHKLILDRTALGSTTTQLVRHAPCAILIAPGGAIEDAVPGEIDEAA